MRSGLRKTARGSATRFGFTLVELLIVILILTIISLNAVPKFAQAMQRQSVTTAARRVNIDIAQTQLRAKSTSLSQSMIFAPDIDAYFIPGLRPLESNQTTYRVDLNIHPYNASIEWAEFESAADSDIAFNEHGIPDSIGAVQVQVGKYRRTISIKETGDVELSPITLAP